jgi:nucleotide-binding universal stress UspA family protein
MNPCYNNILIPVDNTLNTKKAVEKAIALVNPAQSIVHLAQLINTWNPFAGLEDATAYEAGTKDALDSYIKALLNLLRWKDLIEKNGHNTKVKIHIKRGPSINLFIQDVTQRTAIDLIIIARDKTTRWLPAPYSRSGDRIARETRCSVLSLLIQKKQGFREETQILSEFLEEPHNSGNHDGDTTPGFTSVYDRLSSN